MERGVGIERGKRERERGGATSSSRPDSRMTPRFIRTTCTSMYFNTHTHRHTRTLTGWLP